MPIKRLLLVVILLVALLTVWVGLYPRQTPAQELRWVGQIIIKGNTKTTDEEILKLIPLFPGQVLTFPELQQAEKNLKKLNGTIKVIDRPKGIEFLDLLVEIQEK